MYMESKKCRKDQKPTTMYNNSSVKDGVVLGRTKCQEDAVAALWEMHAPFPFLHAFLDGWIVQYDPGSNSPVPKMLTAR